VKQIQLSTEIIEGDVLCVGGGIAGLFAAIRAGELGARVIVADKANTLRSGSAATGNDHFQCYLPEFHGPDIEPVIAYRKRRMGMGGIGLSDAAVRVRIEKSTEIIKRLESWGVPMKYKGKYEFAGHAIPGVDFFLHLKYAGMNQKPILTREARKQGVKIVNRVMVFDLIYSNGRPVGAIGVDTRNDKIVIFHVKAVILATGLCGRLYPSPTPGWMFNRADSPHTTGDGRAMAYRAGAELMNMELVHRWAGPKYFSRCGKGTWVGVFRDPQGNAVGPFVTKPDRKYGDSISDAYTGLFNDYVKSGKGPVYMDCRGITREDYEYMIYWLKQEGNCALVDHLDEEGIDLKKNPVEFMTYEMSTRGGVSFNERGETSLPGLYAGGDEYFGAGAAAFGWVSGENAAGYAADKKALDLARGKDTIERDKTFFESIRNRQTGAGWQEVNTAVNQVMFDYAGTVRYETLLDAGLAHLVRIKKKAAESLTAGNAHELMHCLEVLNLLDIAETVFTAIRERKETRESYTRLDYPFKNPVLDGKTLFCKKGRHGPVTEWKKVQ